MLHTVNSLLDPQDEARVRVVVLDSATNNILDEFDVGETGYDYYQGSIAVNAAGQVVIGYNRSGLDPATGKIGFYARAYKTLADGTLVETMAETLLKESLTNDYHNGSVDGQPAAGRQRWGDYSQVSVDPTQYDGFWVIGQFAREPNNAANGHPGGTGGTRWSTWIANIRAGAVPEPATWAMMLIGFGFVGAGMRRARSVTVSFG
ncbi:PEP-CTERM sorting domain-containing protein [Sphingomonas sp. ID1715]|nr:PEP-CTERM sorting domain-containing protein [Sphingomonas sp. ID1715]